MLLANRFYLFSCSLILNIINKQVDWITEIALNKCINKKSAGRGLSGWRAVWKPADLFSSEEFWFPSWPAPRLQHCGPAQENSTLTHWLLMQAEWINQAGLPSSSGCGWKVWWNTCAASCCARARGSRSKHNNGKCVLLTNIYLLLPLTCGFWAFHRFSSQQYWTEISRSSLIHLLVFLFVHLNE